ncbi:PspC domain-containing protein [[Eubacterium] cellulosolvens]
MEDKRFNDNRNQDASGVRSSNANPRSSWDSGSSGYQNWSQGYSDQPPNYSRNKKLYRSTRNKWIGGVCGGLAEHFNTDPVLVRLLWVVVTIFSVGIGIIAYILFWIFLDKNPGHYYLASQYMTTDEKGDRHFHYRYRLTQ